MRILVACHCKKPIYEEENNYTSPELKLISNKNNINTSSTELYYIDHDDRCAKSDDIPIQFKDWGSIPKDYFDYVWLENCPLWRKDIPIAKSIFESAYDVLKNAGKVIFCIHTVYSTEKTQTDYIASIINMLGNTGINYYLEVINKEELPLYFIPTTLKELSCDKYIILTKVELSGAGGAGGGAGGTGVTERRKTRRRQRGGGERDDVLIKATNRYTSHRRTTRRRQQRKTHQSH